MVRNFFAVLQQTGSSTAIKNPSLDSQVAPYKILGRFYRVPIKSLLRVQIKWAIDHHNKKAPTFFMSGSFLFNLWLLAAAAKCTHTWLWLSRHIRRVQGRQKKNIVVDKSSIGMCSVHNLNSFMNYLPKIGGDQSPKPHTFRRLCMHHVCLQIWMYGLYREIK